MGSKVADGSIDATVSSQQTGRCLYLDVPPCPNRSRSNTGLHQSAARDVEHGQRKIPEEDYLIIDADNRIEQLQKEHAPKIEELENSLKASNEVS
jgi:hypothetical protein